MNKLLLLLCVGLIVFSCKSKKAVVTKEVNTSSEQVDPKQKEKVYADKTERYIDIHKGTAQQEMKLYGIPASITLAQGILESGSGQGRLAVKGNNHFGIKCHEWTGGKIYHDDDEKQECFRKYVDAKYSFRDHSLFLTERSRYSKLFDLNQKDYTGWARGLSSAGYATDKSYPQKLTYIIERYRLYKLDEEVLAENLSKVKSPTSNKEEVAVERYVEKETPASVGREVYTVQKGDTQYSISKKYNITVKKLQNLNGLSNTNLNVGQVLVVVPSSNSNRNVAKVSKEDNVLVVPSLSSDRKLHKVSKGDTQYSISKKYNITVKELQSLNGLSNTNLNLGQILVVSPSSISTTNTNNRLVHKVLKGDTQYSISKKYNITVKELQNLNGLSSTNLSVGQVLVVKPSSKN